MNKIVSAASHQDVVAVRSREEIENEMGKVLKAKDTAEKKISRCEKRMIELSNELQLASRSENEVK
jgi:hypothetical protein